MSKLSRSKSSSISLSLSDDDSFFKQYAEKRMKEINKDIKDLQNQVSKYKQWKPKHSDYINAAKQYNINQNLITEYVKRGTEINAHLRGAIQIKFQKDFFKNFDGTFKKLKDVLNHKDNEMPLLKVYRTMTRKYEGGLARGYISTSNKLVSMANNEKMIIFIPDDVNVIITDISKGTKTPNTFEIILPSKTELLLIEEHENYSIYIVDSVLSRENRQLYKALIQKFNKFSPSI